MLTSHYFVVSVLIYLSSSTTQDKNGVHKQHLNRLLSKIIDVNRQRIDGIQHGLHVDDTDIAKGYSRKTEGERQKHDVDIYVLDPKYLKEKLSQNENSKLIEFAKQKLNNYNSDSVIHTSFKNSSKDTTNQQILPKLDKNYNNKQGGPNIYNENDFNQQISPDFYNEDYVNDNVLRRWKSCRKSAIKSCKKACSKGSSRACREYKCKKGVKKLFKKECSSACNREFSERSSKEDDDYNSDDDCMASELGWFIRTGLPCDDVADDDGDEDVYDDDDQSSLSLSLEL